MNAIKKEEILAQFDRMQRIVARNSNQTVTPAQNEAKAERLEKGGEAEAAYAVRRAYVLADRSDGDSKVTKDDLKRLRGDVEREIDRVNGGFETLGVRELGRVKNQYRGLVSALVEMSRTATFAAALPPYETFAKALDHLQLVLVKNAGEDRVMTPDEAKKRAQGLRVAGRHTEALALENLFTIAEKQAGAGRNAPVANLEGAIAWAKDAIKRRLDGGRTQDMPETWLAIARLGQALEAGVLEPYASTKVAEAFERWKASDETERFELSWRISDNDAGGVNVPSVAGADVAAKMKDFADGRLAELAKDGYTVVERSEDSQTVKNAEGLDAPISHSAYARLTKPGHPELALELFFDLQGNDRGVRLIDPQPEGLLGPPRLSGDSSDYPVSSKWQPAERATDAEVLARVADRTDRNAALMFLGRMYLLGGMDHMRNNRGVVEPDGDTNMWEVGTARRYGKNYDVVRWADSSDASYTLWFKSEKVGETERLRLDIVNFDN